MDKKLIILMIAILILSSVGFTFAADTVEINRQESMIQVNGANVDNEKLVYPFIVYNDITYFPLSWNSLYYADYKLSWREDENAIAVSDNGQFVRNYKNIEESYVVEDTFHQAEVADVELYVNDTLVDTGDYPILHMNDIYYMPLTSDVSKQLGWQLHWNEFTGMMIYTYTLTEEEAEEAKEAADDQLYELMASFMLTVNKNLTIEEAKYYVSLIVEHSATYDIDPIWIEAMMWQESWFDKNCYYHGAVGLMQMMGSTARSMGISEQDLYDPAISIEYGVKYFAGHLDYYDGSYDLATTSYNQGTTRVDKGTYSTKYLNQVTEKYNKINDYIESNME